MTNRDPTCSPCLGMSRRTRKRCKRVVPHADPDTAYCYAHRISLPAVNIGNGWGAVYLAQWRRDDVGYLRALEDAIAMTLRSVREDHVCTGASCAVCGT